MPGLPETATENQNQGHHQPQADPFGPGQDSTTTTLKIPLKDHTATKGATTTPAARARCLPRAESLLPGPLGTEQCLDALHLLLKHRLQSALLAINSL